MKLLNNQISDKIIYLILCWYFGIFGAHRFYRKQISLGIVYILTLGFLGIGVLTDFVVGLIDLVRYLSEDHE